MEPNELYSTIRQKLFATLWELQNTSPNEKLKEYLQTKLETYYDLIHESLDDDWCRQIDKALQ